MLIPYLMSIWLLWKCMRTSWYFFSVTCKWIYYYVSMVNVVRYLHRCAVNCAEYPISWYLMRLWVWGKTSPSILSQWWQLDQELHFHAVILQWNVFYKMQRQKTSLCNGEMWEIMTSMKSHCSCVQLIYFSHFYLRLKSLASGLILA